MPLVFDDRGLLPPGIHDATFAEVEEAFARFQRSDRRMNLFGKLKEYLAALATTDWAWSVLIDGSFVMPMVDEPNDIDLVLVLPADWDATADLRPFEYNLVSKKRVRQQYQFDMFVTRSGNVDEAKWVDFFGRVNVKWCELFQLPDGSRKGLVRVTR